MLTTDYTKKVIWIFEIYYYGINKKPVLYLWGWEKPIMHSYFICNNKWNSTNADMALFLIMV